ncbi:hypothetical protein [Thermoflavimicrobium daqui]|jgi:hypothetical protein|uniref:hypothetical protein n=1 Tax=Thermoflavimicrobium daqui TaxID=2137476 RepID=UPI00143D64F9|nr:hypothetical protein [Thermoflavimicrobium daqui]
MSKQEGWFAAKKGEGFLKNGWQNHENEKPFTTLFNEKKVTLSNFFTKAPKKW